MQREGRVPTSRGRIALPDTGGVPVLPVAVALLLGICAVGTLGVRR
jgi:hypothetical protein